MIKRSSHGCFHIGPISRSWSSSALGYRLGLIIDARPLYTGLYENSHVITSKYHIISYHILDLKRQNRFKVGTDKPKLQVKMQPVSDDDVRKRLLEKPRFELGVKGVLRLGKCYIFSNRYFTHATTVADLLLLG